jgi:hypothetical protein
LGLRNRSSGDPGTSFGKTKAGVLAFCSRLQPRGNDRSRYRLLPRHSIGSTGDGGPTRSGLRHSRYLRAGAHDYAYRSFLFIPPSPTEDDLGLRPDPEPLIDRRNASRGTCGKSSDVALRRLPIRCPKIQHRGAAIAAGTPCAPLRLVRALHPWAHTGARRDRRTKSAAAAQRTIA